MLNFSAMPVIVLCSLEDEALVLRERFFLALSGDCGVIQDLTTTSLHIAWQYHLNSVQYTILMLPEICLIPWQGEQNQHPLLRMHVKPCPRDGL